jgi:hypothetical protein
MIMIPKSLFALTLFPYDQQYHLRLKPISLSNEGKRISDDIEGRVAFVGYSTGGTLWHNITTGGDIAKMIFTQRTPKFSIA